jgi:predicted chitinase
MRSSDFIYESGWRKPISPADQERINKRKAKVYNQPGQPDTRPTNPKKAERSIEHLKKIDEEVSESAKKKIAAALLGMGLLATPSKIDQQHPPLAKSLVSKAISGLNKIEQGIKDAAEEAGVTGHEIAQMLAQTAQETGNFVHMRETGSKEYFLKKYWYNKDVRRRLGNKTPQDALNFIGRGYVHLTGRANYDRMSDKLGIDLVNNPELAERPDIAMKIMLRYFKDRVEPNVQDFTDTNAVTDQINKHEKPESRQDRENKYQKYKELLRL